MSYCWQEIITQQCCGRLGAFYSRISGELPVFLIPPSLQTTSPRAIIRHEMALVLWISHHVSTPLCAQHNKILHQNRWGFTRRFLTTFLFVALSHWVKWTAKRDYPARLLTSVFLLINMGVKKKFTEINFSHYLFLWRPFHLNMSLCNIRYAGSRFSKN